MENKDNKSNEMSEEVITNDATKDDANTAVITREVIKGNTNGIANANKDVITRNLAVLGEYRTFAESLINTDLGARFKENVVKDGIATEVINIDNMVTCLLTGQELGLSPMTSLAYGRNLNLDAIQKVELGKTLGLSVTASLKNIFCFESGGTRQVYTGINVVEGCLNKHHIDINIDEDFVPVYKYFNMQLNKPIIEFNPDRHIDIDEYNDDYVRSMMADKGMVPVSRIVDTYRTTVSLIRKGKKTTISYTLQEAIDAGLKSGKHSITGQDVKGKDNWDKHTRSLMRKMAIMIAARICANDILNGMYCDIELKDVKHINDDTVDVQYVEADDNANY